jgi:hypothetical protein
MLPRTALALALLALAPAALPAQALGGAPLSVPLGAAARDVAIAGDGSLAVVATADGAFGFTPQGALRFHALDGTDATSVAVDASGSTVVAGDSLGLVHFLRGDGTEFLTGLAIGAVRTVDVTADGRSAVAGTDMNWVFSYRTDRLLPPPAPAPPTPLPLTLYQWAVRTDAPVSAVHVTADGQWVNAATQQVFAFDNNGALVAQVDWRGPCQFNALGPKCWLAIEFGAGGVVSFMAAARSSYDILVGWTHLPVQHEKVTLTTGTWEYFAPASPTAGAMSATGARTLVGDALGEVRYLDALPVPCCSKLPLWTAQLGARVDQAAVSGDGRFAAAATSTNVVTAWVGAAGPAPLWTYAAPGTVAGLAFTPDGSALVGAAGTMALFWT